MSEKQITLQRFQSIVLRLGNQMFVRHYLWLNYPNEPQTMGIEFIGQAPTGKRRAVSCSCGTCSKCKYREYVASRRLNTQLRSELANFGFTFDAALGIWTIGRDV